ncbi:MAG: ADP-glyceromanno-heptose 6-epimerase [Bacteroidales bacterium]|nr:ADP-glyceromanno-heptose 6-epimerase [Bacteroidales bacterium]
MIIVTGAAGFIGSCLVGKLNNRGIKEIGIVDDFSHPSKARNTENKAFEISVDRQEFADWFRKNHELVEIVFHIGARTDTTEFNMAIFDELNLGYSKEVWNLCVQYSIPLIYASSAATYGDGLLGYADDQALIPQLQPLNSYGISKNEFDKWVLKQEKAPPFWYGLKFFNVYGPNEYHKGRMASVVFHAFNQIRDTGSSKLFRSHHPAYRDGEQLRDFIYVKDVEEVLLFLMTYGRDSGIYNLGTGKARTFLDLVHAVFNASSKEPMIEFIDTPIDIREKYQYFTEADMKKLRSIGYQKPFTSLEEGIREYVQEYLTETNCL